jgi:hypothetical protein
VSDVELGLNHKGMKTRRTHEETKISTPLMNADGPLMNIKTLFQLASDQRSSAVLPKTFLSSFFSFFVRPSRLRAFVVSIPHG